MTQANTRRTAANRGVKKFRHKLLKRLLALRCSTQYIQPHGLADVVGQYGPFALQFDFFLSVSCKNTCAGLICNGQIQSRDKNIPGRKPARVTWKDLTELKQTPSNWSKKFKKKSSRAVEWAFALSQSILHETNLFVSVSNADGKVPNGIAKVTPKQKSQGIN